MCCYAKHFPALVLASLAQRAVIGRDIATRWVVMVPGKWDLICEGLRYSTLGKQ